MKKLIILSILIGLTGCDIDVPNNNMADHERIDALEASMDYLYERLEVQEQKIKYLCEYYNANCPNPPTENSL